MHPGQGPGLSLHDLGETGGSDTVTLLESEIPAHSHPWTVSQSDGGDTSPASELFATGIGVEAFTAPTSLVQMNPNTLTPAGGDQPHNNLMPYLTFYFNIALQGVYPPR